MKWLGVLTLLLALASCANSYNSHIKKENKMLSGKKYYITILSATDIEEALQVTKAPR